MKKTRRKQVLHAVLRHLREHRRDFLSCQTIGATNNPKDLEPEFRGELRRLDSLIRSVVALLQWQDEQS